MISIFVFTPQLLISKNGEIAYQAALLYRAAGNKEQTITWLKKAIDEGNANAAGDLGFSYEKGEGVEKNAEKAMTFYKMAADRGDYFAMFILGMKYQNDPKQALSWFTKSMETKPNSCAADMLGYLYATGLGVKQNTSKAKDYFYKSGYIIEFRRHTIPKTALIKVYAEYQFSKTINKDDPAIFKNLSQDEIETIKDISTQATKKCY